MVNYIMFVNSQNYCIQNNFLKYYQIYISTLRNLILFEIIFKRIILL